jgi:hypothetical protein
VSRGQVLVRMVRLPAGAVAVGIAVLLVVQDTMRRSPP